LKFAVANDDGAHSGPLRWGREGVLHVTPRGFPTAMERAIRALASSASDSARTYLGRLEARSKDELYQRLGWMPRVHPLVLPSGRWLLPLYSDTFDASIIAITDDCGLSWRASEPMISFGNIQPSLVRRVDGRIVAFMRDNGTHRRIREAVSADDGFTWGAVLDSPLPNPGSGVDAARLRSGRWVIVYNDTTRGRHSLAISTSEDEGLSWKWTRHVEQQEPGRGQYHYPSVISARDGLIHVTYTHGGGPQRSTIQHAVFNEEWATGSDAQQGH
jgi:hypothetical protein